MSSILKLPIEDRIRLVEDIWDSIAADQSALDLTEAQKLELDRRLDAFEKDGETGREASEVIADIRSKL
jgi:putative addiction module component (TIGR02574 family)